MNTSGSFIEINIRGHKIKFKTVSGVFAKHGLDDGSKLLMENMTIIDQTLIADLGCGSGVVGILAAKLNPNGHVHLLDDHLRSINLCKENVQINNLHNTEIYLSDLFSEVENRTYHLIVSNPPQQMGNEFLYEIALESFNHLKTKGRLLVVVKNNLKEVTKKILQSCFDNYYILKTSREHTVMEATKLS